MRTAIVMPVRDALPFVQQSLAAIEEQYPDVPLVLVDDASGPETAAWLEDYVLRRSGLEHSVGLYRHPRQQLFTRTVNHGLRVANAWKHFDAVAVVNTDCDLRAGWLDALTAGMTERVGMVGYPDTPEGKKPLYREVRVPAYVTGHCMLLSLAALRELGVFCETDLTGRDDPVLAPFHGQAHLGSERIWGWRAQAAGWKTVYCHAPLCFHEAGGSWGLNLGWLASLDLRPLWAPNDSLLDPVHWYEDSS